MTTQYTIVNWDDTGYQIIDAFLDKDLAEKAKELYSESYSDLEILTIVPSDRLPLAYYEYTIREDARLPHLDNSHNRKDFLACGDSEDPWKEFIEDKASMDYHKYDACLEAGKPIAYFVGYGLTLEEAREEAEKKKAKYTDPNHPLNNIYTYYRACLNYAPGKRYHNILARVETVVVKDGKKFEDIAAEHEKEEIADRIDRDEFVCFWGVGLNETKAFKDAQRIRDIVLGKRGLHVS